MKNIISILLILFVVQLSTAQKKYLFEDNFSGTEVGINMSSLVSKLLPFQNSSIVTGPYNILIRPGSNSRFFQLKIGANIPTFSFFGDPGSDIHLNLSIGWFKRNVLDKRFSYSFGHNLMAYAGSFNTPADVGGESFGIGYGFEGNICFHINKWIGIETGLTLFAGIDDGILRITAIPPVAINAIVRLPKKAKVK